MAKTDDSTKTQDISVMRGLPSQVDNREATRPETFTEVGWRAVCGKSRKHGSEGGQGFLRDRLPYPTFGDASLPSKPYIEDMYADTKGDVYKAFVECFQDRLVPAGMLGIISSRTGFFLGQSADWRERIVLRLYRPVALADFGSGVLDAMVETAAYVLRALSNAEDRQLTLRLLPEVIEVSTDRDGCFSIPKYQQKRNGLKRHQAEGEIGRLLQVGYLVEVPGHFRRFQPQDNIIRSAPVPQPEAFDELMCFRLVDVEDKGDQLVEAIQSLPLAQTNRVTHVVNPTSFRKVPGSPFAYWVSERVQRLFTELLPFEGEGRTVKQGLATADDFRFVRAWWEVPPARLLDGANGPKWQQEPAVFQTWCRQRTLTGQGWVPFAKGGAYSPYYADMHLVVDWERDGEIMKAWADPLYGNSGWSRIIKSVDFYFRPGLTWPRRTQLGLNLRAYPAGAIFADKGPVAFLPQEDLSSYLALTNSHAFGVVISLQMAFGSYEVGVVQRSPVPNCMSFDGKQLGQLAQSTIATKQSLDTADETSHIFVLPALLQVAGDTLVARAQSWAGRITATASYLTDLQHQIDAVVNRLYGIDAEGQMAMRVAPEDGGTTADENEDDEALEVEGTSIADAYSLVHDLIAYILGTALGRWDIRYPTGQWTRPALPDPFAPLPVCSPGMLAQTNGLPAELGDVSGDYPLRISWSGILVDDDGHPADIIGGIRKTLEVIWPSTASEIEQEACDLLGVKSLRDYITRPNGFFADHIKRYSKSRRKAPLYWPLSTASGSYSVRVYYHRLTDQTLYTIVNRYLEPKVEDVQRGMVRIEEDLPHVSGADAARLRDTLHTHRKWLDELQDMKQELLRVAALPYKPDLNDGVIINAAPLYKLFQHRAWAKDCADCWKKLEKGDYDWSHMAFNLWPERVREKCKNDRSLAIAHGLEDIYEVPLPGEKKTRKRA